MLDDISIDVDLSVDDSALDGLIGKLEWLDSEDPFEVELDVEVNDDALDDIGESAVSDQVINVDAGMDMDDIDLDIPELDSETITIDADTDLSGLDIPQDGIKIPVSGSDEDFTLTPETDLNELELPSEGLELTVSDETQSQFDVNAPDGGFDINFPEPDGSGFDLDLNLDEDSEIRSLSSDEIGKYEGILGEAFDPRGMINKELTLSDIIDPGGGDTPVFDIRENRVDDLINEDRPTRGIEHFFDFDMPDMDFAEMVELEREGELDFSEIISFPDTDRGLLDRGLDKLLGRDPITGERDSSQGLFGNLSLERFYRYIAMLVPALLTFALSMPAAIAAIGTLAAGAIAAAGALFAVGGLMAVGGALVLGEGNLQAGFTELVNILKADIMPVVKQLGSMFDGLFFDMLNQFENFMNALASNAIVLTRLKDDVRALAGFIVDFVPPALAMLAKFGDAMTPIFAMFGEWLSMNFDNLLVGFVNATKQALPYVIQFINGLIQFAPLLFDISLGFLIVTSTLMRFLGGIANFLQWLGPLGTMLGIVAGSLLTLATIGAILVSVWSIMSVALVPLIVGLFSYATSAVAAMFAAAGLTLSTWQLYTAVSALIGLLTLGVGLVIGLAGGFAALSGNIDGATASLDKFTAAQGNVDGMALGSGPTSGLAPGSLGPYEQNIDNSIEVNVENGDGDDMGTTAKRMNYRQSQFRPY
jgi:hypothetical protein